MQDAVREQQCQSRLLRMQLVEEYERKFAHALASRVIPQPSLSIWMVLIPIIFVYYFFQRDRYRSGTEQFKQHYLASRQRALEAADQAVQNGTAPDLEKVARASQLPAEAHLAYRRYMGVLIGHYRALLQGEGDTFAALVRSAYGSKTNYLLFTNELNQAEEKLNAALEHQLPQTTLGYHDTVRRIEEISAELRRQQADLIFG